MKKPRIFLAQSQWIVKAPPFKRAQDGAIHSPMLEIVSAGDTEVTDYLTDPSGSSSRSVLSDAQGLRSTSG